MIKIICCRAAMKKSLWQSISLERHLREIVEDLEDGDDGKAHAEAQDAAAVGHEPDDGNSLRRGSNRRSRRWGNNQDRNNLSKIMNTVDFLIITNLSVYRDGLKSGP